MSEAPTVSFTVEPEIPAETNTSTETVAQAAAESAVIAAETAGVLANGMAALATQQAAETIAEHREEVAEVQREQEWQGSTLQDMFSLMNEIRNRLETVESNQAQILSEQSTQSASEEVGTAVIEAMSEEVMNSTPQSTSEETSETPTEATAVSAEDEPEAVAVTVRIPKVRLV